MAGMIQQIREYRYAKPFVPFKIRTLEGEEFLISSFDHVGTPPGRNRVIVFSDDDTLTALAESKIASVERNAASAD